MANPTWYLVNRLTELISGFKCYNLRITGISSEPYALIKLDILVTVFVDGDDKNYVHT